MIRTEITITDSECDSKAQELRLSDLFLDSSKRKICLDVVDISEAEEKLTSRMYVSADELLEAARMLVARTDKVTARY